jgi:REP element-mobilizing transposase RayT
MNSRSRGYLPHLEIPEGTYFLTFRLADSIPSSLLVNLKAELFMKKGARTPEAMVLEKDQYERKINALLDKGRGDCWLNNPDIAGIVVETLRQFDGEKYFLHAWTVMPNHVHVLFTLERLSSLSSIIQSWKGSTAFQANRILHRTGRFWQPEYFDRLVKTKRQFEFYLRYILNNPVKAGLCLEIQQWRWSGCSADLHYDVDRFFRLAD